MSQCIRIVFVKVSRTRTAMVVLYRVRKVRYDRLFALEEPVKILEHPVG